PWRWLKHGFSDADERSRHLIARKPARVLELGRIDGQIAGGRLRYAADHERGGKWPWLACDIADIEDFDASLFLHFARDRILNGFANLDETGERRITSLGVMRLSAKQDLPVPFDKHDCDWIDAREMFRTAMLAGA